MVQNFGVGAPNGVLAGVLSALTPDFIAAELYTGTEVLEVAPVADHHAAWDCSVSGTAAV